MFRTPAHGLIGKPYDGPLWGKAMITGGNATVFVADMDRAVAFYTEVLSLKLTSRYEDSWATVDAGAFTIGLHPVDPKHAMPGTKGAIMIGLTTDEAIDLARAKLEACHTRNLGEVHRGDGGNFVYFEDPDGNELYLWQMPNL